MKTILAIAFCFCTGHFAADQPEHLFIEYQAGLSERQKIERLILYVRSMKGAVFIRNNSEHSPEEAADHLRLKLSKAGSKVKTARDFIRFCATGSSLSGKSYHIKTADGKVRTSGEVLTEELLKMEKNKT